MTSKQVRDFLVAAEVGKLARPAFVLPAHACGPCRGRAVDKIPPIPGPEHERCRIILAAVADVNRGSAK